MGHGPGLDGFRRPQRLLLRQGLPDGVPQGGDRQQGRRHGQARQGPQHGQPRSACADIGGYSAVTGNTGSTTVGDGPTKWDGKEWPVPYESYVASDTVGAATGTFIAPSSDTGGVGHIAAFRGPVF